MTIPTELISDPEAQNVLRTILEATRESVMIVDKKCRILTGNRTARKSFAKKGEDLDGRSITDVFNNPDLVAAFRRACEEGETSDTDLEFTKRGTRKYDVHVAPLELDGERRGIGYFYDVTQVERLETIRQEFLSNISHELRTPLTSILAFVETLESGALEDDQNNRHFLSVIRRNGERMRNLIADILELSQIESGNVTLHRQDVKLGHLVDEIFTSLSSMAVGREITLVNKIEKTSVVKADPKRLEQMLTNLVDNAIRFNRRGGSVTVSDELRTKRHNIFVSDTGEGILPDQIDRIFERFYRADRARSRDVGGTGLGLAIVKHLSRIHGGEVSVQSEQSVGTTFTIELPNK